MGENEKKRSDEDNLQLARHILNQLRERGIQELCICPGARNSSWIEILVAEPHLFQCYYFFEERSAAFFALGRIRRTRRPCAILTTSGTAVGELLPATMEAFYSGYPLVLVTADRPRRYRGSGAPQAAEQVGIFGPYVRASIDLEGKERPVVSSLIRNSPVHLNVCFEERGIAFQGSLTPQGQVREGLEGALTPPLGPEGAYSGLKVGASLSSMEEFLRRVRCPLVIVGMLAPEDREAVTQLLLRWDVPIYLEGLSGLRESSCLEHLRVYSPTGIVQKAHSLDYPIDGVVRIGGVPTLRFWRDLEYPLEDLPVLSLSGLPFSGLGRPSSHIQGPIPDLCHTFEGPLRQWILNQCQEKKGTAASRYLEHEREREVRVRALLEREPRSEPGIVAALSLRIPKRARLYLGNSLPIREWDLAATRESRGYDLWASRGLNGIDGQVSTFLGFAEENQDNWAILGDLTTLYDLPGPWILNQLARTQVNLVVINNGGGKIFERMFPQKEIQNQHSLEFRPWAELWGLKYEKWSSVPETIDRANQSRLIEIVPDDEATQRFWNRFSEEG